MKFRTKIWMLPAGAALVFAIGLVGSYLVGARTLQALNQLSKVDGPALQQLRRADQGIDQFRLMLQSAAVEGDTDKLKDIQTSVDRARAAVERLGMLPGKSALAAELLSAFDSYQVAALETAKAMLGHTDAAAQVARMQGAQGKLDRLLKRAVQDAAALTDELQEQVVEGVGTVLWVNLGIGLAVIVLLGVASKFVIRSVWRELGEEPDTLHQLTRRIADGDLQLEGRLARDDDRSLNAAIASMAGRLRETVGTIRDASESIAQASFEIAAGNANLSARTEASASNLQQTASSIAQLTVSVQQSAESAREASRLAGVTSAAAQRGGEIVAQVTSNMNEISAASRKIGDIIGVIDSIAFQTNILALNAAVEAARAGEQGRGFAVVAAEVRNLAHRSASAAREIKGLISTSTDKVDGGARLVQDAGQAMSEIVAGVQRVTGMIGEISTEATAQSATISEVHSAANALDQMTQQNSALVEEASAAAQSMREQAGRLKSLVDSFRVGSHPGAALALANSR